jgi:hypothetical protein
MLKSPSFPIGIKASIDQYCRFTVTTYDDGRIALLADNGLYLSRINMGALNAVCATKTSIDVYSQFMVELVSQV